MLTSPPTFSTTPSASLTTQQAANEVAWALENAGSTVTDRAATQLFIWSVIDQHFSVTNWNGNTAVQTAYTALVLLSGYNPTMNYLPAPNSSAPSMMEICIRTLPMLSLVASRLLLLFPSHRRW